MNEDKYKVIFSKNLKKYMLINNKTQTNLINDLGFNKSAVSTWCNGSRLPRMDKIDMLAQYFGINRSDLIEENAAQTETITNIDSDDGIVWTEEELQEIENFKKYLLSKRNK